MALPPLPSYFYGQFGVSKVQAGQLAMLAAFMGAALRVFGGGISDHWGGVNTLTGVLAVVSVTLVLCGLAEESLPMTMLLFLICFAALGAGRERRTRSNPIENDGENPGIPRSICSFFVQIAHRIDHVEYRLHHHIWLVPMDVMTTVGAHLDATQC